MIGICYLVKEDADTVAEHIDELCKNKRYDGAFWEEALYSDRMTAVLAWFTQQMLWKLTLMSNYERLTASPIS